MRRIIASLAAVGLLLSLTSSSVEAFNSYGANYPVGSHVTYCFDANSFLTYNRRENMRVAIEQIDQESGGIYLDKVDYDGSCDVHIYSYAYSGAPMRWITSSNSIEINENFDFYWPQEASTCVNLPPNNQCLPAAWTTIQHEFLHVLGLEHPSGGDCDPGYASWNVTAACDSIGERVMFSQAGDGYFRNLSADDIAGIVWMYGQ